MLRILHLLLIFLLPASLAAIAVWFQSWGALALLLIGGLGWVWYRLQVARSAAAERFFGEPDEETRLTSIQASPSEMPVDRSTPRRRP